MSSVPPSLRSWSTHEVPVVSVRTDAKISDYLEKERQEKIDGEKARFEALSPGEQVEEIKRRIQASRVRSRISLGLSSEEQTDEEVTAE